MTIENAIGKEYGITLSRMIDRIEWTVDNYLYTDDVKPAHLRSQIVSFMLTHGENAIVAMFGFLRYVERFEGLDDEKKERMIKTTLAHDLNAWNDPLTLPRSSGYMEYAHIN